jgi:hypothetical protein
MARLLLVISTGAEPDLKRFACRLTARVLCGDLNLSPRAAKKTPFLAVQSRRALGCVAIEQIVHFRRNGICTGSGPVCEKLAHLTELNRKKRIVTSARRF